MQHTRITMAVACSVALRIKWDSVDPEKMKYIGPEKIYHVQIGDKTRKTVSTLITIRACDRDLRRLNSLWSRHVDDMLSGYPGGRP